MRDIYVKTMPNITYKDICSKSYSLSSTLYKKLKINNTNLKSVKDFLSRDLERCDLGSEVGSINYIEDSPHFFLRTKALQDYSFIPEITSESAVSIRPKSFVDMKLAKGDLIISKDGNIGEIVILDKDYPNYMLCGALYRLPITEHKYYLLAFLKHKIFREQIDYLVPKGATIRHAGNRFLECKIPLPTKNYDNTIKYIELLTESIIKKEVLIKERHSNILEMIEQELNTNQKIDKKFEYHLPRFSELKKVGRLDTGVYSRRYKKITFLIENYNTGCANIKELGFTLNRGQNLQESNIGKSIYSERYYGDFYTLLLPTHFSEYGSVNKLLYLGNYRELNTLAKGMLVFGAEGTFRSIVVCSDTDKCITNIHGITLYNKDLELSIFIKCFLDYLRKNDIINCVTVGGHGGSFAQKYWDLIQFPKFPKSKQYEISLLYHNPECKYKKTIDLKNFLEQDEQFNRVAGIYELDKKAKQLKVLLNQAIDNIINDIEVKFNLDSLL